VDRFDPLQCLPGLVQVGHRLGVAESSVIENNGYLIVLCFAHKSGHGQDYLLGVLVALDRGQPCAAAPTRRTSRSSTRGRGGQYTSRQFATRLENHKIFPFVSRTGVCWDNARAQVIQCHIEERTPPPHGVPHAGKAINFFYLVDRDRPCNQTRLHLTLDYRTPNEAKHELNSHKHAA